MEDVDPDLGVKKQRKLCSKFFYFLLLHMQLPNFILLITGIGVSVYWYRYQYTVPVFFTGTHLKIIDVTNSLHNLSFLDPDPDLDPNRVVLDPGSRSK